MPKIKMTDDQLDSIVRNELKSAIKIQLSFEPRDRDYELLAALQTVTRYYTTYDEYTRFAIKHGLAP